MGDKPSLSDMPYEKKRKIFEAQVNGDDSGDEDESSPRPPASDQPDGAEPSKNPERFTQNGTTSNLQSDSHMMQPTSSSENKDTSPQSFPPAPVDSLPVILDRPHSAASLLSGYTPSVESAYGSDGGHSPSQKMSTSGSSSMDFNWQLQNNTVGTTSMEDGRHTQFSKMEKDRKMADMPRQDGHGQGETRAMWSNPKNSDRRVPYSILKKNNSSSSTDEDESGPRNVAVNNSKVTFKKDIHTAYEIAPDLTSGSSSTKDLHHSDLVSLHGDIKKILLSAHKSKSWTKASDVPSDTRSSSLPDITPELVEKLAQCPGIQHHVNSSLHYLDTDEMKVDSMDRVALHEFINSLIEDASAHVRQSPAPSADPVSDLAEVIVYHLHHAERTANNLSLPHHRHLLEGITSVLSQELVPKRQCASVHSTAVTHGAQLESRSLPKITPELVQELSHCPVVAEHLESSLALHGGDGQVDPTDNAALESFIQMILADALEDMEDNADALEDLISNYANSVTNVLQAATVLPGEGHVTRNEPSFASDTSSAVPSGLSSTLSGLLSMWEASASAYNKDVEDAARGSPSRKEATSSTYVTPSMLHRKMANREWNENLQESVLSYMTPSEQLIKCEDGVEGMWNKSLTHDYPMPSELLLKGIKVEDSEHKSEKIKRRHDKNIPLTTTSEVVPQKKTGRTLPPPGTKLQESESKPSNLSLPTPSLLLHKVLELEKKMDDKTNPHHVDKFTEMSTLVKKVKNKKKMDVLEADTSADLPYTTPSELLAKYYDEANREQERLTRSSVFDHHVTPSALLGKVLQHEKTEGVNIADRKPLPQTNLGTGNKKSEHLVTISELFKRVQELEQKSTNEKKDHLEGHVTPSMLLQKTILREDRQLKKQDLGSLSYTTPSVLLKKMIKQSNTDYKLSSHVTPSKLHQKIKDREKNDDNKGSYDWTSHITPSALHRKILNCEKNDAKEDYHFASHVTPSKLLWMVTNQENSESQGGDYDPTDHVTPSQLCHHDYAVEENENKLKSSNHDQPSTSGVSPPLLLQCLIKQCEQSTQTSFTALTPTAVSSHSIADDDLMSPSIIEMLDTVWKKTAEVEHTVSDLVAKLVAWEMQEEEAGHNPETEFHVPTSVIDMAGDHDDFDEYDEEIIIDATPSQLVLVLLVMAEQHDPNNLLILGLTPSQLYDLIDGPTVSASSQYEDHDFNSLDDAWMSVLDFLTNLQDPSREESYYDDDMFEVSFSDLVNAVTGILDEDSSCGYPSSMNTVRSLESLKTIASSRQGSFSDTYIKMPHRVYGHLKQICPNVSFGDSYIDKSTRTPSTAAYTIKQALDPVSSAVSSSSSVCVPPNSKSNSTLLLQEAESHMTSATPTELVIHSLLQFYERQSEQAQAGSAFPGAICRPEKDLWKGHTPPQKFDSSSRKPVSQRTTPLKEHSALVPRAPGHVVPYQTPPIPKGHPVPFTPTRATAQTPDQSKFLTNTDKRIAQAEVRKSVVEKEVAESQLRKLQVENSTLVTENKLIKEKYNKAQLHIHELENRLLVSERKCDSLEHQLRDSTSEASRSSRVSAQKAGQELQSLSHDVELLHAENSSLRNELENLTRRESQLPNTSRVLESYRIDNLSLKAELDRGRENLQQSERALQDEKQRSIEDTRQIARLTDLKSRLEQELDLAHGASNVAEKQLKSLERRLKITEDRLHQERADRANKLSDVEEKLIHENAKLQVFQKENQRQLSRERERVKKLEGKLKEYRLDNDRLQVILKERPHATEDNTKWMKIREELGTKKQSDDMKYIRESLREEDNLGEGQEQEIIWLLWQHREELVNELWDLKVSLSQLKIDPDNASIRLKMLMDERQGYDDRIRSYKDTLDDLNREREELDRQFRNQLQSVLKDKHDNLAHIRNMEDSQAALTAENHSLKTLLQGPAARPAKPLTQPSHWQGQMESLQAELQAVKGDLSTQQRSARLLEAEAESLDARLTAKEHALEEALAEIQRLQSSKDTGVSLSGRYQEKVGRLTNEVKELQAEVSYWRDKQKDAPQDCWMSVTGTVHSMPESNKLSLEHVLHEKESEVLHLTIQCNAGEDELQRTKHLLVTTRLHSDEAQSQLDQLQAELRRKGRLLERASSTDLQKQAHIQSLGENLNAANVELTEKATQLKMCRIQLTQQEERIRHLEDELGKRERQLSGNIAQLIKDGTVSPGLISTSVAMDTDTLTGAEARVWLMEQEKQGISEEFKTLQDAMSKLIRENSELVSCVRVAKQDLVKERAQLCQVTSEKVEADQRLRVLKAECEGIQQEKAHLQLSVSKLEEQAQVAIHRIEIDHQKASLDFEQKYHSLDAEGKKIACELGTSQRLLDAREKEIDLLNSTVNHQKHEIYSLGQQIQMLKEENKHSHTEVSKLTAELSAKVQEYAMSSEVAQSLTNEKARLQQEKYHLQQNMGQEKDEVERRNQQMADLMRKIENSEEQQRLTEKQLHQKETMLVALETELKHVNKNLASLEAEREHLRNQVEKMTEELRTISSLNSTLEQRLNLEKSTLNEEKSSQGKMKDELKSFGHQVDILKQENTIIKSQLESERHTVVSLKEKCQQEENHVSDLEEQLHALEMEMESLKHHLDTAVKTIDQYKLDKNMLYQDVQDLCRKLSDKDEVITKLQAKCREVAASLEKDFQVEKASLLREKGKAEEEKSQLSCECDDLKERLKHKELQLDAYLRTSKDLDNEIKNRIELETQIEQQERHLSEANITIAELQTAKTHLEEQLRKTQEKLAQVEQQEQSLQEELHVQKERHTLDLEHHKLEASQTQNTHDAQRASIQEQLNKTTAELKATEASLAAAQETKQDLVQRQQDTENKLTAMQTQVHDEITTRKLTEQNLEVTRNQIQHTKSAQEGQEQLVRELQGRLAKTEVELNSEQDGYRKLNQELQQAQQQNASQEAQNVTLQAELSSMTAEITNLRSQLDAHKQNLHGKNKKLSLELRQQMELNDSERSKLIQQIQQLSVDLEEARHQVGLKNRDNLQLQEELLSIEAKHREASCQLKQVSDKISLEMDSRKLIEQRVHDLELELSRVRVKGDSDGDNLPTDTTRLEMNKMISDMKQQMQLQLESQKAMDREARTRDQKQIDELKKKLVSVESNLSQEMSMHTVTRTQMTSLEDDNQRLRTQLQSARKRHQSDSQERSKSRVEEINEIIAKSQTRAQQMLAAVNLGVDTTLKSHTPDSLLPSGRMNYLINATSPITPDRRSHTSDDMHASLSPDVSFTRPTVK